MSLSLLSGLKRLWYAWNIRGCMLISLLLQALLLLLAPLRKHWEKKPLLGFIWLTYLLWNTLDTAAIALISRNKGDPSKLKDGGEDFLALWASFLLLHLGGPDAITSFAIEDNQFWLRHLVEFVLQVLTTAYLFCISFPQSKIWIPTAMVLSAGTIKFAERVFCLYNASLDRFGPLEQRKEYDGPDYEEAVRINYPVSLVDVLEHEEAENVEDPQNTNQQKDLTLLKEAAHLFDTLKGFIVGTIFSSIHRNKSRRRFLQKESNEAFRLIEYELSFMYDLFHTKVVVACSLWGCVLRVVCFFFILVALISFVLLEKQNEFHNKVDVKITYALLTGALGLEIINALMLLFSDWTVIALEGWKNCFSPSIFTRRRWSRSCSQYDMISYCLNGPPKWMSRLGAFGKYLEKMYIWHSSKSSIVGEHLEKFIFEQLKCRSEAAKDLRAGMEACSQRGAKALLQTNWQTNRGFKLKWSIEEYEYGDSLLLWHMATEICYQRLNAQEQKEKHPGSPEKICKQLSDYMFYLLVTEPTLMAPVLGGWERAFKDTCAEAKRFFSRKRLKGTDQRKACMEIISVKTPVRPDIVKGSECKSVLFDASILAKQLSKSGNSQWFLMSEVWMELVTYAAINCKPILHAQQPSRGGELLTFVWLLMNHLGLGTQFYEYERQTQTIMGNE